MPLAEIGILLIVRKRNCWFPTILLCCDSFWTFWANMGLTGWLGLRSRSEVLGRSSRPGSRRSTTGRRSAAGRSGRSRRSVRSKRNSQRGKKVKIAIWSIWQFGSAPLLVWMTRGSNAFEESNITSPEIWLFSCFYSIPCCSVIFLVFLNQDLRLYDTVYDYKSVMDDSTNGQLLLEVKEV